MPRTTAQVSATLDAELADAMEEWTKDNNTSDAECVRQALIQLLEEEGYL